MEPVIKVRYKTSALLALLLAFNLISPGTAGAGCDKSPKDQYASKSDGDNGFAIQINGSPRLYRPNQIYTITLRSTVEDQITKFTNFLLVSESAENSKRAAGIPPNVGTFQLMPGEAMTKFSHKCSNAIEATSSISKEQVQVYWTSPPRGSGCIQFSALIVERQDVWYMDDGGLSYTLCEDNSPLAEPPVVEPCCACDEAKYEVIFEGIWSRHTHPKDFPKDEWRTQFSKLIGASHSVNYTLWEYGRQASVPLQILGEHGITRRLETEMKSFSQEIRSVIKAQGLQQRSNVAGQTFAVFRVDPTHHLLSLVSKMIPSPDWIVGLSKENLCLPNCSWVANRVIDLYPWDIGTQSGLMYDSPPSPQRPKGAIQRITSTNPNAEESPFHDSTGAPMKPAARLHILRQREYRKVCPDQRQRFGGPDRDLNPSWSPGQYGSGFGGGGGGGGQGGSNLGGGGGNPETGDDSYIYTGEGIGQQPTEGYDDYGGYSSGTQGQANSNPCEVTDWGMWSECSATCGPASRSRTRSYADEAAAEENYCQTELREKEPCRNWARCPPRSYAGSFQPFAVGEEDTSLPGYSSAWTARGLESDGLQAPNSYHYETGKTQNVPKMMYGKNGAYQPQQPQQPQPQPPQQPYQRGGYQRSNVYSYTYGGSGMATVPPPQFARLKDESSADNIDPEEEVEDVEDVRTTEVDCSLSDWGEWSDCSSECDRGTRTRFRRYNNPQRSSHCSAELDGMEPCHGSGPLCPQTSAEVSEREEEEREGEEELPTSVRLGAGYSKPHYQEDHEKCATSEWSEWSPCSQTCGEAVFKTRTRLFLIPFVEDRSCDLRLIETQSCNVPRCFGNFFGTPNSDSLYGPSLSNRYRDDLDTNYDDDDSNPGSLMPTETPSQPEEEEQPPPPKPFRCNLKPNRGSCSGVFTRWYYDPESDNCKTFTFHGCKGNKNNFASEEKCMEVCGPERTSTGMESYEEAREAGNGESWSSTVNEDASYSERKRPYVYGKLKTLSLVKENYAEEEEPRQLDDIMEETTEEPYLDVQPYFVKPKVDCIVSSWSEWTPCSKSCGIGWTTRDREVIIPPDNGGKECPKKLMRKRKCREMPCPADTKYWYHGSWRHMAGFADDSNDHQ